MLLDHRSGLSESMQAYGKLSDIELLSPPGVEEHYFPLNNEL